MGDGRGGGQEGRKGDGGEWVEGMIGGRVRGEEGGKGGST